MIATCLHEHRNVGYLPTRGMQTGDCERLMKIDYYLHKTGEEAGIMVEAAEAVDAAEAAEAADAADATDAANAAEAVEAVGAANAANAMVCANGVAYRADSISYGIKITMIDTGILEEACVEGVTENYEKAKKILLTLADNQVTPCCLREILEDICAADCMY